MYQDALFIVFVAALSTVCGEIISWMLVYRTETYQQLQEKIESLNVQIEKLGGKPKKAQLLQKHLQEKQQELSMQKLKSSVCVGVILFFVYRYLSSSYDGLVVARLPFTPPNLLQGLTHRNLPGQDSTECSMAFIYLLCSFGVRPNLQKLMGVAPKSFDFSGKKYL